jgi:hypothetical protein
MRRAPFVEKDICDIDEDDIRVSITGTVIKKDPIQYSMVIDDGTASITVFTDTLYEIQSIIRVLGRPQIRGEPVVEARIVQDFTDFDLELFKKIREMES